MKTRELIAELQRLDPTGELPCIVWGASITFVDVAPGYYDGPYFDVTMTEEGQYGTATLRRDGDKLRLDTTSVEDLLCTHPDFPVEVTTGVERDVERVAAAREKAIELHTRVEAEHFARWVAGKVACPPHQVGVASIEWFREHFVGGHHSGSTPMPEDICSRRELSWADRRELQWEREVSVQMTESGLVLELRAQETP